MQTQEIKKNVFSNNVIEKIFFDSNVPLLVAR